MAEKDFFNLVDFINQPSKTYIRCDSKTNSMAQNIRLLEKSGIKSELYIKNFLTVKSSNSKILDSELFKEGNISIQSPSAAAIVDCLDANVGDVILDVCAAPGTKTLQLANLVGHEGYVYASDISPNRVKAGKKDTKRHRKKNIEWSLKDASKDSYNIADKILIDAPCTGTGVIGRKPDIRWRRKENDIKKFSDIQLSIINNCSKYLKKGGVLVYATCSMEPEENLKVIEQFLNLNSDFVIDKIPNSIPEHWIKDQVSLNILPHLHGIDGVFAMRMKKNMIKTLLIYFVNLSFISLLLILLFDSFLMPKYVRMGTGKYMVNVIKKNLDYGRKVLESEGYKIIVSDTLFTSSYDPGIIIDQYPKPNTRVKEGRTIRLKISQPEKNGFHPRFNRKIIT